MERDGAVTAIDFEGFETGVERGTLASEVSCLLKRLGVPPELYSEGSLFARSPIDGSRIGKLHNADFASADSTLQRAEQAAAHWSGVSPSRRGELVRRISDRLREVQAPLARLLTIETGKTIDESSREVAFASACCDKAFAVAREIGQSSMRTERNGFWIHETWRPLGVTGCISPFNRPLSQFAGLCFTSVVCGNAVVWKPSERASLSALALQTLIMNEARDMGDVPEGLIGLIFGGPDVGKIVAEDFRLRFLDAATSISAGRFINTKIAQNFMRGALSLGGNNAAVVCSSADLAAAINAIVASATMSGGQHPMCTRRLFVHKDLYGVLLDRLKAVFARLPVGDPRCPGIMMGPLIDRHAFEKMQRVLIAARNANAKVTGGARIDMPEHPGGYYVRPAIVEVRKQDEAMLRESLVPIVYVTPFVHLRDAIGMDGASESGMASAIFTRNMAEVDEFVGLTNCGMLNINVSHAGYEVGIAPAGAKASGGGRLSSTSSWKVFMQRCIISMNMSNKDTVPDVLGMVERGEI